jgi:hypothetical protein
MSQKKTTSSSELRIRCDEALYRKIEEAARRSLRSMTREVIFRLRASLISESRHASADNFDSRNTMRG